MDCQGIEWLCACSSMYIKWQRVDHRVSVVDYFSGRHQLSYWSNTRPWMLKRNDNVKNCFPIVGISSDSSVMNAQLTAALHCVHYTLPHSMDQRLMARYLRARDPEYMLVLPSFQMSPMLTEIEKVSIFSSFYFCATPPSSSSSSTLQLFLRS